MLKKTVTIFVTLCFISLSLFAYVQTNSDSDNLGKEVELSKNVVPISDQELEMTNGLGLWDCIKATALYIAVLAASSAITTVGGAFAAAVAISIAFEEMMGNCNLSY